MGLPTRLPNGMAPQRLLQHMRLDKKSVSGGLRLILWRGIGRAEIVDGVDATAILDQLKNTAAAA